MTREEAIKVLNTYDVNFYEYRAEEIVDAIGMAIEALKAKTDGDIISRQDAIEAIESRHTEQWIESDIDYNSGLESALCEIKALPSAEPKTGKWVLDPNGMNWNIPAWRCSECGYVASHIGIADKGIGSNPMNWAGSKYCPECGCKIVGARMRGEDE